MACTKALSDFSCSAPPLPGLTNSRKIASTLGGGVVSCATAIPIPPTNRYHPNSHPVIFFMDADLLGREVDLDSDSWKRPGTKQLKGQPRSWGGDYSEPAAKSSGVQWRTGAL